MRSLFKMMKGFGYVLLITPPHAIDLTVSHRQKQGELAKQSLLMVMVVELLIRTALILLVAVSLESLIGNTTYETYMLDTVFSMLVVLGALHSFAYFLFLGYLRPSIGLKLGMRLYRFFRNLCYAAIPGLIVVVPVLLWKWKQGQLPFDDGIVFQIYTITTLLMIAAGIIEALIMKRKPLGLDVHLRAD
ncbi:MAG: hypothetical protein GY820_23115 [Gammaproteobacteria bacterium]|nr:hypothetical protein [Gammaproteobacteria bacterium]